MNKVLIAAMAAASVAVAAAAQAPEEPARAKRDDPNQIVCVNVNEIGSRLNRRRVCRTRAEWDELAQQTRDNVERAQSLKATTGQ